MSYPQPTGKRPLKDRIWFNLFLMFLVCILLFLLFFVSLSFITNHGDEKKVPNITGKSAAEAVKTLEAMGFEVKVDSTYEPDKKPFAVLLQLPEAGETVKTGRPLFLTVNRHDPPTTPMPKVVDLNYRSAVLILQSNRLIIGDTTHKPDIGKDVVLDVLYNGKTIAPGTMIPQGSKISLVIGDGLGNTENPVPDLIGMPYNEVVALLSSNNLSIVPVFDAGITDTGSAIIYNQTPAAISDLGVPSRIHEGDGVTIFVSQNPSDSLKDYYRNLWKENMKATPVDTNTPH